MRCESIGEFQSWLKSKKIPEDNFFKHMEEKGGNMFVAFVFDHPNGATVQFQALDFKRMNLENVAQMVKMNWPKDPVMQTQLLAAVKEAGDNEKAIAIIDQFIKG